MTVVYFSLIVIAICIAYGIALARGDAKRSDALDAELFWRDPSTPRLTLPIARMHRDQKLAFHGKVRQQIRTIPAPRPFDPRREQPIPIPRDGR